MATTTTNYKLVKPALTDAPPDITVMNPNWDTIDSELKKRTTLDEVKRGVKPADIGAVDKAGDTMTGNLMIKNSSPTLQLIDSQISSNQSYSEIRKNASSEVDYGTYISDVSNGTKDVLTITRANDLDDKLQLRVESDDGSTTANYKLYGTHNTHAEIKQYADLADLGLTVGSETIESIATKLPTYSRLIATVGSTNNLSIYPNSYYGTLVVDKALNSRILFTFVNNQGVMWVGAYAINSSGNTWTGWKQQANTSYAVNKAGDTMTGWITFNNPSEYHAFHKIRTIDGDTRGVNVGCGQLGGVGVIAMELRQGSSVTGTQLARLEIGQLGVSFVNEAGKRTYIHENTLTSSTVVD